MSACVFLYEYKKTFNKRLVPNFSKKNNNKRLVSVFIFMNKFFFYKIYWYVLSLFSVMIVP